MLLTEYLSKPIRSLMTECNEATSFFSVYIVLFLQSLRIAFVDVSYVIFLLFFLREKEVIMLMYDKS